MEWAHSYRKGRAGNIRDVGVRKGKVKNKRQNRRWGSEWDQETISPSHVAPDPHGY